MVVDLRPGSSEETLLLAPTRKFFAARKDALEDLKLIIDPRDPFIVAEILAQLAHSKKLVYLEITPHLQGSECSRLDALDHSYMKALSGVLRSRVEDYECILHSLGDLEALEELSLCGFRVGAFASLSANPPHHLKSI